MDIVNRVLKWVQDGINTIFGFIASMINWTVIQFQEFFNQNWASLSVFKLALGAAVLGGAGWILWKGGRELFDATLKLFEAFANFVSKLIKTIPWIVLAGLVILFGKWLMKTFPF